MKTTTETEKNLDKKVLDYFNQTGKLFPEVLQLDPDMIKELIDAIPNGYTSLINQLRGILSWEGE